MGLGSSQGEQGVGYLRRMPALQSQNQEYVRMVVSNARQNYPVGWHLYSRGVLPSPSATPGFGTRFRSRNGPLGGGVFQSRHWSRYVATLAIFGEKISTYS